MSHGRQGLSQPSPTQFLFAPCRTSVSVLPLGRVGDVQTFLYAMQALLHMDSACNRVEHAINAATPFCARIDSNRHNVIASHESYFDCVGL